MTNVTFAWNSWSHQAPGCSFPAEHWSCIFTGGDSKQRASQTSPVWLKILKGLREVPGCQKSNQIFEKKSLATIISLEFVLKQWHQRSLQVRTSVPCPKMNISTGKKLIVWSHVSIVADPFHDQKSLLRDVHVFEVDAFIRRGDLDHAFVATWAC